MSLKSKSTVYSPTVQFYLSVAVPNLHSAMSAYYSDALKTVIDHLTVSSPSNLT